VRHRKRAPRERPVAIGYTRVSTDRQTENGVSLAAQERAIRDECGRRGWELAKVATDAGLSGREMRKRPALLEALESLEAGEADALLAPKLDRLSRSSRDALDMLERARRGH
jgi:DNA invertase Pin-like site-specific DNA recombinase